MRLATQGECEDRRSGPHPDLGGLDRAISRLTKEMKDATKNLDFEKTEIRDRLRELKEIRIFV